MNAIDLFAGCGGLSKGFMDAVRITDFPIRDHKVILVLRRRRWKNKETGETVVDRISVTE